MKKIIFVCTGSTCRSPMARAILKHKLKQKGIINFNVDAAGIKVALGSKTNNKAIFALKDLGINARVQNSKQLTKKLVTKNTILIPVTKEHADYVKNIAKVRCLSDFNDGMDLLDPYGMDLEAYKECAKILDKACDKIVEQIINEGEL